VPSAEFDIWIYPGGRAQFIFSPAAARFTEGLGARATRRVSRVEPAGETWQADLRAVDGPVLGPFPLTDRNAAIEAELAWLHGRLANGPLEVTDGESED